ncbi:hypothetical protein [Chitinophaga tropicalis]|uniref:Uncharacterized protein n=1 Tax=Chitinophaga tropicalis TaxID=2683588 RepID=A0A7K1U4K0_9BACT|nr:hypothetical protein [Chitinophaga tropicalis]MVT09287.1 hypothetical protein [Chitinophaga tropicalis]
MKQKIINPNKGVEPVPQDKPSDNAVSQPAEEIDAPNIYLPGYSDPFMPIMDLTIVFDELKKIVNNWFFK